MHLAQHGLSCKSNQGRIPRHNNFNDIIHRTLSGAKVPSHLESSGLCCSDGKHPDGMTMVPWSQGKFLLWDATCVDTFCPSNQLRASLESGGAAARAEFEQTRSMPTLITRIISNLLLWKPAAPLVLIQGLSCRILDTASGWPWERPSHSLSCSSTCQ